MISNLFRSPTSRARAGRALASVVAISAIAASGVVGNGLSTPASAAPGAATITKGANPDSAKEAEVASWKDQLNGNLHEYWAHSPSMNRDVPLAVITPSEDKGPRPTYYLLNGGDGGEGRANWLAQTDVVNYFSSKNVNVVIPMAGKFSYYTDWQEPNANLDGGAGVQKWETFLTQELPGPLESALGGNGKRAISGMSMSATTSLLYAEHHPGLYNAIGSFSGCAQTSTLPGSVWVDVTLNRGKANRQQMWGPDNGEVARYNDALANADKLKGQDNIYISSSTGLAGQFDLPSSPNNQGPQAIANTLVLNTQGGPIEGAVNMCTHDLKAKMDAQQIPATWEFRPSGTHSWGYWEEDMKKSWETVISKGLGVEA